MKIEPFQFEDLMGESSLAWYRLTEPDRKNLAFFKDLFAKNNEASVQSDPKIPKVLHWIWVGPKPFPERSKKNLLSWQALHPDWTLKFWTDNPKKKAPIPGMQICSIHTLPTSLISYLIPQACNYGEQSDLIRYIILLNEGGIYVDHDVLAILPFDSLRRYDFFAYLETPLDLPFQVFDDNIRLNNGLVGASAGHPILKKVIENVAEIWASLQFEYPNNDPDSQIVRTLKRTFFMFTKGALQAIDQPGYCDIVFPASFGCPRFGFYTPWFKKELQKHSFIYAEHSHDSLWCHQYANKISKFTWRTFYLILHVILTVFICFFFFYKFKSAKLKIRSKE
jgi:mannosyltransferase OCH1-like enzyme